MLTTSRYGNLLIDTVQRLSAAPTMDARWQEIIGIAGGLGATAVAGGAVSTRTRLPEWSVYEMEAAWLDEYGAARLHEVDPVLWSLMAGGLPAVIDIVNFGRGRSEDPRRAQFNAGLQRYGYTHCVCALQTQGAREKSLTLVTDTDPSDLFGRGTAQAFRAVSAVMLDFLEPPGDPKALVTRGTGTDRLSGPERDILSLMAQGVALEDIARKLRLSSERVQLFLQNSMSKLGTTDDTQTMARAMARGLLSL